MIYSNVLDNLKAGNISAAASAFTNTAFGKYRTAFMQAGAGMNARVNGSSVVKSVRLIEGFAEIIVVRTTAQEPVRYSVFLTRDGDGVWRIDKF